ncbi:recombinase family protein [Fictibacillus sp. 26RED30]|nr:recombinase family protein [Fictibacillus sp. 26RED30]MBH0160463.1 recombinase family protein [Fictibacillus sp. 26RED30]
MIAFYARVSTEEQVKKGLSLEDQIKECRKKAQTDEVIEYVDRGCSLM